jgi:hypothetical protein
MAALVVALQPPGFDESGEEREGAAPDAAPAADQAAAVAAVAGSLQASCLSPDGLPAEDEAAAVPAAAAGGGWGPPAAVVSAAMGPIPEEAPYTQRPANPGCEGQDVAAAGGVTTPSKPGRMLNASDPMVSPGRITLASKIKSARLTSSERGAGRGGWVGGFHGLYVLVGLQLDAGLTDRGNRPFNNPTQTCTGSWAPQALAPPRRAAAPGPRATHALDSDTPSRAGGAAGGGGGGRQAAINHA